jgi:hypothetical protein
VDFPDPSSFRPRLPGHQPASGRQEPPAEPAPARSDRAGETEDEILRLFKGYVSTVDGLMTGAPAISLDSLMHAAGTDQEPVPEEDLADDLYVVGPHAARADIVLDPAVRKSYLDILKAMRGSRGGATPPERRHLFSHLQSLLHSLAKAERESARFLHKTVDQSLRQFDKVALCTLIGDVIGHRPDAVTFDLPDYGDAIPELEAMLDRSAIYLKANLGFRGESVVRLARCDDGIAVTDAAGKTRVFPRLEYYRPHGGDHPSMNVFIAEAEIPIARTHEGGTWEVRMLPPFGSECTYAKLGKAGSIVNNTAQGGRRIGAERGLQSVIRAQYPQAEPREMEERAAQFLADAAGLAARVKNLTDELQIQVARAVVQPGDLKPSADYESTMRYCFSGNFLCVDITGAWNQHGDLTPVIIEAQTSAALPEALGPAAYETCLGALNAKTAHLRKALQ